MMSRPVFDVMMSQSPGSFDFSLLSGAFKLFFDNKPCYQFSVHPASAFEADDVKVMSFFKFHHFSIVGTFYFPIFHYSSSIVAGGLPVQS